MRHDDLGPEEQARQGALDRTWRAAQEALSDEDFRARLQASVDRVKWSCLAALKATDDPDAFFRRNADIPPGGT